MSNGEPQVAGRWPRGVLLAGALAGGAAAQYWLSAHHVAAWSATAWVAAVVCFVFLYALSRDARALPAAAPDLSRAAEWRWCAAVGAVGLCFSLFRLWEFPPGLNHDAAWEGLYAIRILQGIPYVPYVNMAWGRETLTFYLRALSILILGRTQMAVQAPSVVAGILTLPFLYWWARNMFGPRFALLATLLLGVSGWHLIFSRTGWRSDFQPLCTAITCCFFVRGMRTGSVSDFLLSGVGLALTLNIYNGARALPLLFPLWSLAVLVRTADRKAWLRRYVFGWLAMAVGFAVVITPLARYAVHNWDTFMSRAEFLVGTTSLLDNIKAMALMYNFWGNGEDFFIDTPGLEYAPAVFLVFGVLWSLAQWRDARAQFILLGFLVNALPGLISKPNMNRTIGTMPFVYFFVALGVTFFAMQLRQLVPRVGRAVALLFVVAVGAAATYATYQQYLSHNRRPIWGYYPETTVLGKYIKTLVPDYKIWVGDTPYFPRDAMTYLSYTDGNPLEKRNYTWVDDVRTLLRTPLTAPSGKGLAFLLEYGGRGPGVLAELVRRYPTHEVVELRYPAESGRIFAKGVLVPAAAAALGPVATSGPVPDGRDVGGAPVEAVPPQEPPGVLHEPRGVAVAADGNMFVCDFGNNRIQEFGRDLKFVRQWGNRGEQPGQFKQACGVAVGPDGNVFVADTWNQRVQVFSPTGAFVRDWSAGFYSLRGIAVDASGGIFVADSGNDRVLRFSASGQIEKQWGGKGTAPGKFTEPVGIATDAAGKVYVCDNGNGRLQIFTRDGQFVTAFPVPGWEGKVYSEPYVTIDPRGTIWVTVPVAKEVRNYDNTGKLLRTITGTSLPGVPFGTPIGISYSVASHELIVTDIENRLVRIPYAHDERRKVTR